MSKVYIFFGYPGTGKTNLSRCFSEQLGAKLFSVDDYRSIPPKGKSNLSSDYLEKLKGDEFGSIYYSFLTHIHSINVLENSSIIIDAPLIDKKRRKALFEVLGKFKIQNLYLFQMQCSDIVLWKTRILNKGTEIDECVFEEYKEKFNELEEFELEILNYNCMVAYNIDTSQSNSKQILFFDGKQSLDFINNILNNEQMESHKELNVENYKMITTYISDINRKIDVYIKLNLTLFIAVMTFIISNLPNTYIKYAFIPLTLINWISYKYFNANNRLLVTMQAHIANTYEKYLEYGWYIKSLQFRESKPIKEKNKKKFSPINFYGFLIAFSVGAYIILFTWELIKNKNKIIIDFSLPIDYQLAFNFTITGLFLILGIIAFIKIIRYPDWPSLFKQKHQKFNDLKKSEA